MPSRQPLENPIAVGLAVLLIAFSGRGAALSLPRLHLPEESLVAEAVNRYLRPAQEGGSPLNFSLDRQVVDISLKYANALADGFIQNSLLPPADWKIPPAIAQTAGDAGVTVEHIRWENSRFVCTVQGDGAQALTAFAAALEETERFPGLAVEPAQDSSADGKDFVLLLSWEG